MTATSPVAQMEARSCPHVLVTYANRPSGVKATVDGASPTGIVAVTALVPVSMTETLGDAVWVTYAKRPSGEMAIPIGSVPTEKLTPPVTRPARASTTERLAAREFDTYTNGCAAPGATGRSSIDAAARPRRRPRVHH